MRRRKTAGYRFKFDADDKIYHIGRPLYVGGVGKRGSTGIMIECTWMPIDRRDKEQLRLSLDPGYKVLYKLFNITTIHIENYGYGWDKWAQVTHMDVESGVITLSLPDSYIFAPTRKQAMRLYEYTLFSNGLIEAEDLKEEP